MMIANTRVRTWSRRRAVVLSRFVLLLIVTLGLRSTAIAAQSPAVEIAESVWTSSVENLQYTNRIEDGAIVPVAPICFWTRMRGTQEALDQLRAEHKLPIRHRWVRYVGYEPNIDSLAPTDEITLGVGASRLVSKLRREVANRGWFDWRTWSMKEHLTPGKWQVSVVYRNGEPVLCSSDGAVPTPCRFFINVGE